MITSRSFGRTLTLIDARPRARSPQLRSLVLVAAPAIVAAILTATVLGLAPTGTERIGTTVALVPASTGAASIRLRFDDRTDGGISVYDADSGHLIEDLAPASNGFLRGVLRSLVRERTARGLGPEAAFTLLRGGSGQLTLTDSATGQLVALNAFGPTNAAAFARFLVAASQTGKDGVR